MIYAQIKNGIISNIIRLEQDSLKTRFGADAGFDAFVRIDLLNPRPGPGWLYDYINQVFTEPEYDEIEGG